MLSIVLAVLTAGAVGMFAFPEFFAFAGLTAVQGAAFVGGLLGVLAIGFDLEWLQIALVFATFALNVSSALFYQSAWLSHLSNILPQAIIDFFGEWFVLFYISVESVLLWTSLVAIRDGISIAEGFGAVAYEVGELSGGVVSGLVGGAVDGLFGSSGGTFDGILSLALIGGFAYWLLTRKSDSTGTTVITNPQPSERVANE